MPTLPVPDHDSGTAGLTLAFRADPASVRHALEGMLSLAPLAHLPDEDRSMAELVLAEVLNNVAEHAYGDTGGRVEVSLQQGPDGLRCRIIDEGRAMPDGRLPDGRLPGGPDVALADLPEGGFGWHLIRSLSTDLTYTRVEGQNRLSFVLAPGR